MFWLMMVGFSPRAFAADPQRKTKRKSYADSAFPDGLPDAERVESLREMPCDEICKQLFYRQMKYF